mgnify:CR=1 FL=1
MATKYSSPIIPTASTFRWIGAMLAAPVAAEQASEDASIVRDRVPMFEAAPLSDNELAATTGRENDNWMSAATNNSAVVANNRVGDNTTTGTVNVTDSAFQNVSGISMVNFNTGNNSSINAGMSVNLQINYAPIP